MIDNHSDETKIANSMYTLDVSMASETGVSQIMYELRLYINGKAITEEYTHFFDK